MIVHPAALREIERSAAWYTKHGSAVVGRRFRHAVADILEAIERTPHVFAKAHDDTSMSQAWVDAFPYRIVFFVRERDGEACVLSVHHARRRPGFWKRQLP